MPNTKRTFVPTFIAITFAALTFVSCKKTDVEVETPAAIPANVEELRSFISKTTGQSLAQIQFNAAKQEFVIAGDALMTLQQANEHFAKRSSETAGTQKEQGITHRKSYYSVNRTKAPAIKIYADASVPATWLTALDNAIVNWNNSGSLINISRVTSSTTTTTTTSPLPGKGKKGNGGGGTTTTTTSVPSYDIIVTTNYETSNTIATAYYPDQYGNPGKTITINTYHNGLNDSYKIFALTHEAGHSFGFAHTDGTYGYLINGTPTADPSSVMNSVCLSWNGFTTYDLQAISLVYPK